MFRGIDISATGLSAQRLRMDVVSSNIVNAEATRAATINGEAVPYRRKLVVFQPERTSFQEMLNTQVNQVAGKGVKVSKIVEDQTPWKLVFNPDHPDAIKDPMAPEYGYVRMPNIDIATEMIDLISAFRAYEAGVTALNSHKAMAMKALEIGK